MADNIAITAGSGTTIATDDVSGVQYQKVKLVDGTADSSTVIASGGGVEAGALRVTIASDSTGVVSVDDNGGSLTVDGAVTANPSKLPTTDDADFVRKYYTNAGAVTDGIIWSPAAGKRWYVTDLIINVSAAATVTLEDDKAGGDDPVLKMELAANGGFVANFKTPLASGEDAADLLITTSAGNCYCTAIGYEI